MRLLLLTLAGLFLSATSNSVQAQEFYEGKPLSHLNVSLGVSTLGVGIEAATPINSYFKLRAGINHMSYTSKFYNIGLEDYNGYIQQAIGYVPDYRMKGKLDFTNGHLLVDFHPVKKGIFHLTAGFYVGQNQIKANGFLADENGDRSTLLDGYDWPTIEFDGHQLEIDNGDLDATLTLGKTIKPYVGLGFGRAISKSRVSFKFEMGAIYQGDYTLKQGGQNIDFIESEIENFTDIDTYTKWLKWWPMLNFQLTYRIF